MENTFFKVANALANNQSVDQIASMFGIPKSRVIAIANSIDDPEEAYRMQIEQAFFDEHGI